MLEHRLIDVLIDARSRCQKDNHIPKLGAMIKDALFSSAPKIFKQQGNFNLIDFGPIKDHRFRDTDCVMGVMLKYGNLSISEVINSFESAPAPKEVLQLFPSLSEQEWSAVLRFSTLVLVSLKRVIRLPKRRKTKALSKRSRTPINVANIMIQARQEYRCETDAKGLTAIILRRLLDYGSETEDNLNAAEHLEFGVATKHAPGYGRAVGIKIKGKPILISDVLYAAEHTPIPSEVLKYISDLTDKEWQATIQFVTLLLVSLERQSEEDQPKSTGGL